MASRNVFHVHYIQASVHVGRKFTLKEIHDDAACGCRFDVPIADGSSRVDHNYISATATGFQSDLFSHELRPLIGADHVCQRDWRSFVCNMPGSAETHGGDRAGIDHAPYLIFLGGANDGASALHVRPIHLAGVTYPEPIVRGHVENKLAALNGFSQ